MWPDGNNNYLIFGHLQQWNLPISLKSCQIRLKILLCHQKNCQRLLKFGQKWPKLCQIWSHCWHEYFVCIQQLCYYWIINSFFTCLVKSKPDKQEVSRTVILPLSLKFLNIPTVKFIQAEHPKLQSLKLWKTLSKTLQRRFERCLSWRRHCRRSSTFEWRCSIKIASHARTGEAATADRWPES